MNRREFTASIAGLALAMASSGSILAAEKYPARTVTLVNPFPPGSPVDIVARELATQLGNYWKQNVIVDNRPGAAGTIGAQSVARARPDGYTLLLTSASTHVIGPAVRKTMPYDPLKDFTPIAFIANGPAIIVVHPSLGVNTLEELIALARQKPATITYASSGVGTILHLTGEVFSQRTGTKLLHVPYQGAVPAATDLLGGHVNMMFDSIANATPQVKAGKLKALAVLMPERTPLLPDVPTAAELGYPDMAVPAWFGFFGPAGLPEDIVKACQEAVQATVANSDQTRQKFMEHGIFVDVLLGDAFVQKMQSDLAFMRDVVQKAGLPPLE